MKANTHPVWFPETRVTCSCGNEFTVGSTQETIHVEICAKCHPFFTGEEKFIDTAGRVERFQTKLSKATGTNVNKKQRKLAKRKLEEEKEKNRPKSFKEMLDKKESTK